jgi:two-component system, NtrC family, sensor kinase
MKIFLSLLIFSLLVFTACGQDDTSSNFVQGYLLKSKAVDTELYNLWYLGEIHLINAPDSALIYAQKGLVLARQLKFSEGEALCLLSIGKIFMNIGNYPKALQTALQSLNIFEHIGVQSEIAINLYFIGEIFNLQGDYIKSLSYNFRAKFIAETIHENRTLIITLLNIGHAYEKLNRLDSALLYAKQSYTLCNHDENKFIIGRSVNLIADIYNESEDLRQSLDFYRLSILYSRIINDSVTISKTYLGIAEVFKKENKKDSCLYYSKQSLLIAQRGKFMLQILNASNFLADYYNEKKIFGSAFSYQQLSINAKDSLFSSQKIMEFQNISFSEQMRQQEIKEAEVRYRNKVSIYILIAALAAFLFVAIILWRNNRQKQKANELLNEQKQEIGIQKTKAENALEDLQLTQAQLIQSEKMASLGELTAGIAHEIQNPLNFVNNFSEVSNEMIAEMVEEADKGNITEVKAIAADIKQNLEKINHHGKRADAIVKGMLQHSRSNSGQKELTSINALADEYLRLSYHGLRAKDKLFNAALHTDFDEGIGKINIIPQDIGRVFLNLYNNAFYAVAEKKKAWVSSVQQIYEPVVSVSTKKIENKIHITVSDNGNGIPQKAVDKIFQPFFTTKPTGQGTGLGLSLSYDIIKTHGGEIKVETKEKEGTAFTVELPLK